MKTYLTYGFAMALAGLLLNLALFFTGFHSDADKLGTAQTIATVIGLVITVAGVVLGTQARRAEKPATEAFTYGNALGAGVLICLFATLLGVVTNYVYMHLINPGMQDLLVQAQIAKWEAAGLTGDQIDNAEKVMRKMMHPALQAVFGLLIGVVFGTIISLVTSAFLRREAAPAVPSAAA